MKCEFDFILQQNIPRTLSAGKSGGKIPFPCFISAFSNGKYLSLLCFLITFYVSFIENKKLFDVHGRSWCKFLFSHIVLDNFSAFIGWKIIPFLFSAL